MSIPFRPILIFASVVVPAACTDTATGPAVPPPLPDLPNAVWFADSADGQALPAMIGHRVVAGQLEQVFLDSLQFEVRDDRSWVQRAWVQTFRGGSHHSSAAVQVAGVWTATDTAYQFADVHGTARFSLRPPVGDPVRLHLRIPGVDGIVDTRLRATRPPAGPEGSWRVNAIRDLPLTTAYLVEDPFDDNGRTVSAHIFVDSAEIRLHPNGTYTHWIRYSQWEGEPGGPPTVKRYAFHHGDHGTWTRNGLAVATESHWLQNHRMTGEFGPGGPVLRMAHGLGHGDAPIDFRYVRR